jgi:hypothetical protein
MGRQGASKGLVSPKQSSRRLQLSMLSASPTHMKRFGNSRTWPFPALKIGGCCFQGCSQRDLTLGRCRAVKLTIEMKPLSVTINQCAKHHLAIALRFVCNESDSGIRKRKTLYTDGSQNEWYSTNKP